MTEWLLFGSLVGVLSTVIDPKTSNGMLGAIIVGITGAFVGGMIGSMVFGAKIAGMSLPVIIAIALASVLVLVSRGLKRL